MTYALKYYRRIKVNIFMQNLKDLHNCRISKAATNISYQHARADSEKAADSICRL
jgi:hypothetical protein